jgi:hypothetical protein
MNENKIAIIKMFQIGEKVTIINLVSDTNTTMAEYKYRKIGLDVSVVSELNDIGTQKVKYYYSDGTSSISQVFPHNLKSSSYNHEPIPLPKVNDLLLADSYINFCQKFEIEEMPFNSYARMMRASKCQLTGVDLNITTAMIICSDPSLGFISGNIVACHRDFANSVNYLSKTGIGLDGLTNGLIKLSKGKGGNGGSRNT